MLVNSYIGATVECPNGIVGTVTHENDEWLVIKDDASDDEYLFTKQGCKIISNEGGTE